MLAHEIARADAILVDQLVELRSLDDPDCGDPAEWPARTDEDIWTIGPEPLPLEPDPDDAGPTEADWDEYARVAEWQDRVEAMHRVTDDDLRAAGLPVG